MVHMKRAYENNFRARIHFWDDRLENIEVAGNHILDMMVNEIMPGDMTNWHLLYAEMLSLAKKYGIKRITHPEMTITFPGMGYLDTEEELLNVRLGMIAIATVTIKTLEKTKNMTTHQSGNLSIRVSNENAGTPATLVATYGQLVYNLEKHSGLVALTNELLKTVGMDLSFYTHDRGLFCHGLVTFQSKAGGKVNSVTIDIGTNPINVKHILNNEWENPAKEVMRRVEMVAQAFRDEFPKVDITYNSLEVKPEIDLFTFEYNGCTMSIRFRQNGTSIEYVKLVNSFGGIADWAAEDLQDFRAVKKLAMREWTGCSISSGNGVFYEGTTICSLGNVTFGYTQTKGNWHFSDLTRENIEEKFENLRCRLSSFKLYVDVYQ